jgi:hypothetical protein
MLSIPRKKILHFMFKWERNILIHHAKIAEYQVLGILIISGTYFSNPFIIIMNPMQEPKSQEQKKKIKSEFSSFKMQKMEVIGDI